MEPIGLNTPRFGLCVGKFDIIVAYNIFEKADITQNTEFWYGYGRNLLKQMKRFSDFKHLLSNIEIKLESIDTEDIPL